MTSVVPSAVSTDALRSRVAADPKVAIKEAAKQFEALFMQQLLKSMRQATLSTGMLDNAGTQMGTEMLDTQFANQMTGLRGGLGDVIARQLERQMGMGTAPVTSMPTGRATAPQTALPSPPRGAGDFSQTNGKARQIEFLQTHQSAARTAETETGIPAAFMLGQAAHETGWGQREIRRADGSSANNLFGIKAGTGWKGAVAEVTTTEYVDGLPRKQTQRFRAYATGEDSFRDYARLMKDNRRYAPVLASGGSAERFAQGLQAAGYATDPAYADRLGRVINTTLRLQRALG
jgi:flagellar protein FlgJ